MTKQTRASPTEPGGWERGRVLLCLSATVTDLEGVGAEKEEKKGAPILKIPVPILFHCLCKPTFQSLCMQEKKHKPTQRR